MKKEIKSQIESYEVDKVSEVNQRYIEVHKSMLRK